MNRTDTAQRKEDLRARVRERRRMIDSAERSGLDERIRGHLLTGVQQRSASMVAAFLAIDGEPDLEPVLRKFQRMGIEMALPVLLGSGQRFLELHQWRADTPMQPNDFGIREPRESSVCALRSIDILVMPLVAYDRQGTRLGMGGGYYDRLLEPRDGSKSPLRVGVAYALQAEPELPRDTWDVPLDAVVNENGWFSFPL